MRARSLSIALCALLAVAGTVAAQSFTQEFDDITLLPGQGWYWQNNSSPAGTTSWAPLAEGFSPRDRGEFQGNDGVFPAYSGAPTSYIADNYNATSGVGTISDWLLTHQVCFVDGDNLTFWTRTAEGSAWPDRLQVRLSLAGASTNVGTGPEDVGDFTTLLADVNPTLAVGGYPEVWTQFTATVTGAPTPTCGRFAFRYYVTGGGPSGNNSNYIGLDLVEFTTSVPVELQSISIE
jgi:hypothetical protein